MISVIIPAYNSARFIKRACESVIRQNFENWELVVVNDGSTDNTAELVESLQAKVPKIKLLNISNGGAYRARLKGVQIAEGEYVLFMDSDDTITKNALNELYSIAVNSGYDIVVGGLNINNKNNFKFKKSGELYSEEYIKLLFEGGTTIGVVAKLFKKSLFTSLCDSTCMGLHNNEDFLMNIELAIKSEKIFIASDTIVYNYIFRNDSISKSKFMSLDCWWRLFEIIDGIISGLHNDDINCAFFKYRLRLLYANILMGHFLDPKDSRIKYINDINLDGKYSHYLKVIKSPFRQRITYVVSKGRNILSKAIKSIYTNE